jgi:flotillin
LLITLTVVFLLIVVSIYWFIILNRIVKCGPNEVMVITGRRRIVRRADGARFMVGYRILRGGRTFVWPFIERAERMSLEVMTLDLNIGGIHTADGATVTVNGAALAKIKGEDIPVHMAAEHFLSKSVSEIGAVVMHILENRLRAVIGSMTVEQIRSDLNGLAEKTQQAASAEFADMGLQVTSLTFKSVSNG